MLSTPVHEVPAALGERGSPARIWLRAKAWYKRALGTRVMNQPEVFGKYQMLTRIASGGMAEVWLARSSSIGGFEKLVAIKRMHSTLSSNESFVSMFIQEAKLTVSLSHPNIVQVFDFGRVDDDYFMAMEYVEGVDVSRLGKRARRRKRALPVEMTLQIMRSVFDGLAYAHTRALSGNGAVGIIHRDISPQNVLVSFDGHVKVSDFGIAQAISTVEESAENEIFGKLAYVSPEQCRGDSLSAATDIWSGGVVLHELLANQRLFARKSDLETMAAVAQGEVAPPAELNPEVPSELSELTLRMLERDWRQRPESARSVAEQLAMILHRHFPAASPYRLVDVMKELWEGDLPRMIPQVLERTADEPVDVTRTRPIGANTAAELAAVVRRQEIRPRSNWSVGDTLRPWIAPPSEAPTDTMVPEDPSSAMTLRDDEIEAMQGLERLKAEFVVRPNLWVLVDIGYAYEAAQEPRRALGAFKLAAAKFAQRGLLVQAATIYRHLFDLRPTDETLRDELRALRSLQGVPDAELFAVIMTSDSGDADFAEYQDVFYANPDKVDVYTESPILSSLSAELLVSFIEAVTLKRFRAEETILQEGESGDSFFLLARGRVLVSATGFEGNRIYVTSLSDGDCFGEHGFFTGEPRTASVEASNDVMVLEVSKNVLNRLILEFPTIRESLRRFYKDRVAESLLAKSQIFGHLSRKARKLFAEHFTFETYEAGDLVIREGDLSDACYAIKSGHVWVYTGPDDNPIKLAELGPGEIFGEIAALDGSKRTASVRAVDECELLRLEAGDLNAMLARNVEIRRLIESKIEERSESKLQRIIESTS